MLRKKKRINSIPTSPIKGAGNSLFYRGARNAQYDVFTHAWWNNVYSNYIRGAYGILVEDLQRWNIKLSRPATYDEFSRFLYDNSTGYVSKHL